jgi:multiple sugar transport system ATP-binding protein
MAELRIEGLSKRFGGTRAVEDVSLTAADGEVLALLGPSGCGKSTLLRLIAGLETPDAGRVRLDGADVTALAPAERDVAMVFQSYALYPHMTVEANVAVPLRLRKVARGEVRRRVDEAAALLGIGHLLDRRPRQLSGGQRQRVAVARAIVRQPRVFLLDEPLSNLDALLRERTRRELKLLFARLGTTVVYVTHDQAEGMTLADRVAVLREGRIEQVGTPAGVYRLPQTRFVAGFVGSPPMNLLPGEVFGRDELRGVVVGVRPEDLEVEQRSTPSARGGGVERADGGLALPARVVLIEDLGGHGVLVLELESAERTRVQALLPRGGESTPPVPGTAVDLLLPRDRLHRFDHATGRRLDS